MVHEVHEIKTTDDQQIDKTEEIPNSLIKPIYTVDISEWARQNHCRYFKVNLWIIGIVLKVSFF